MFNPRFPHTLSVKRAVAVDGMPVIDDNGNPTYETVSLRVVKMWDNEPVRDSAGQFETTCETEVNFGYRVSSKNTQTAGDVIVSDFKIATPMILTELVAGDILILTDYERTYKGVVVKKTTFNLGTNIWLDESKN